MARTKRIAIILVGCIGFLFIGGECPPPTPETPENFRYTGVTPAGDGLILAWDAKGEPDKFIIYADDTPVDTVTTTTATVTTPAKVLKVTAVVDDEESDPAKLDVAPAERTGQEVWERSADGPSAYGWDPATGIGTAYSILDAANFAKFDFYLDDFTPGVVKPAETYFVQPAYNAIGDPFNDVGTGFHRSGLTYDDLKMAPEPKKYDEPRSELPVVGGVTYVFWVDHGNDDVLGAGDFFVKVRVTSVGTDGKVLFDYAFQKIPALRWLKTK